MQKHFNAICYTSKRHLDLGFEPGNSTFVRQRENAYLIKKGGSRTAAFGIILGICGPGRKRSSLQKDLSRPALRDFDQFSVYETIVELGQDVTKSSYIQHRVFSVCALDNTISPVVSDMRGPIRETSFVPNSPKE